VRRAYNRRRRHFFDFGSRRFYAVFIGGVECILISSIAKELVRSKQMVVLLTTFVTTHYNLPM
jgi:hypothetical protein